MQQTPNPAAQFPSLLPLLDAHSVVVKQVPFTVESEVAEHSLKIEIVITYQKPEKI